MNLNQFAISKKEYKKIIKKMPYKRCILCGKKHYVLSFFIPYGQSDKHLKIPYFLCFECFLDADRSSQKAEAIIRRALEDYEETA